ncbi:MAG: heme-binding protein [Methanoregula sp.]|nr:heme-binding protein [Methanoregula sp.]
MPLGRKRVEIPEPLDSRVWIRVLPERDVAMIRFKGYASEDEVNVAELRLSEELKKTGFTTRGQPFQMRYNPP